HVVWEEEGGRRSVRECPLSTSHDTIPGRRPFRGGVSQTRGQEPAVAVQQSHPGRLGPLGGRRPPGGPRAFREGGCHQVLWPHVLPVCPCLPRADESRPRVAEVDSGQEVISRPSFRTITQQRTDSCGPSSQLEYMPPLPCQ